MNSALIKWFHICQIVDFVPSPVPGKDLQVLETNLDTSKLTIENIAEISDEEHKDLEDLFKTDGVEWDNILHERYNSTPCEKVTIFHSHVEDAGYLSFTLTRPTYHQIMESIYATSSCGFDGDVEVYGDSVHGFVEIL